MQLLGVDGCQFGCHPFATSPRRVCPSIYHGTTALGLRLFLDGSPSYVADARALGLGRRILISFLDADFVSETEIGQNLTKVCFQALGERRVQGNREVDADDELVAGAEFRNDFCAQAVPNFWWYVAGEPPFRTLAVGLRNGKTSASKERRRA